MDIIPHFEISALNLNSASTEAQLKSQATDGRNLDSVTIVATGKK